MLSLVLTEIFLLSLLHPPLLAITLAGGILDCTRGMDERVEVEVETEVEIGVEVGGDIDQEPGIEDHLDLPYFVKQDGDIGIIHYQRVGHGHALDLRRENQNPEESIRRWTLDFDLGLRQF